MNFIVVRAKVRLDDLIFSPYLALASHPGVPYKPPKSGLLCLDVIPGADAKENIPALSACDRVCVFEAAMSSVDSVKMISYAIQGVKLRLEEAQNMYYKLLPEIQNKSEVVKLILPYVINAADTKQFVDFVTNHDHQQLSKVKKALGNVLRPAFGIPDGYYCLNLSNELDRICLSRLFEINAGISRTRMLGVKNGAPPISKLLFHQFGLIGGKCHLYWVVCYFLNNLCRYISKGKLELF